MLNLESRNLKFKFDSKDCSMRFPTAREWGVYQSKVSKIKDDSVKLIDAGIEFFVSLGLDKKVAESLEPSHMEKIIEALTKKN